MGVPEKTVSLPYRPLGIQPGSGSVGNYHEINGTDAWVAGKQDEARIWVGKVHDYLTANDPHQRPTTASMSGGEYWPQGYAEVDISNVHMYETGWTAKIFRKCPAPAALIPIIR